MQEETVKKTEQGPVSNENTPQRNSRFGGEGSMLRRKNIRRSGREPRVRSEYDQKMINIRRVARVSSGGRRFSFSVAMIIGNRKGSVGVGTGKGTDTALAIDKATRDAKKNMITVSLTDTSSIAHRVDAKYSSGRIALIPAPGRGVVAGSAVRSVLELAGVKDITAKIFSPSKNTLNIARAALKALSQLRVRNIARPEVKGEEKQS